MKVIVRYLLGLSLAGNQLINALTGGTPTQTVSARAAYAREHGSKIGLGTCVVLDKLDWHREQPGEDHCTKAMRHAAERRAKDAR